MRLTSILNGQHFGNLAKMHGIDTYKLSQFEQRAFAGAIAHGLPNVFRRIRSNIFYVAPFFFVSYYISLAFILGYLTERKHAALLRKNPADYADDE